LFVLVVWLGEFVFFGFFSHSGHGWSSFGLTVTDLFTRDPELRCFCFALALAPVDPPTPSFVAFPRIWGIHDFVSFIDSSLWVPPFLFSKIVVFLATVRPRASAATGMQGRGIVVLFIDVLFRFRIFFFLNTSE